MITAQWDRFHFSVIGDHCATFRGRQLLRAINNIYIYDISDSHISLFSAFGGVT